MLGKNIKVMLSLVLVLSTFLGGLGQLLFKLSMLNLHAELVFFVYLALGVIAYVTSTAFYFYALSKAQLSWVYSFGGLSYIFATIFAVFVLNEVISPLRAIGILVIVVGVGVIGAS
ncbi:MAG: hypothetical protein QW774_04030 [Candidatus Micrarchaeaceae archaeon]